MLIIFRLTKLTGTSATFTIGRDIHFSKLTFKGFNMDFGDASKADAGGSNKPEDGGVPMYLDLDFVTDNEVLFYQGRNNTLGTAVDNLIPLDAFLDGQQYYTPMDLKLINVPTHWTPTQEITITLKQISNNIIRTLTDDQAFGVAVDTTGDDFDHGVNLYFELELNRAHDHDVPDYTIANAS